MLAIPQVKIRGCTQRGWIPEGSLAWAGWLALGTAGSQMPQQHQGWVHSWFQCLCPTMNVMFASHEHNSNPDFCVCNVWHFSVQYTDMNSSRNIFIFGFSLFAGLTIPSWANKNSALLKTGKKWHQKHFLQHEREGKADQRNRLK